MWGGSRPKDLPRGWIKYGWWFVVAAAAIAAVVIGGGGGRWRVCVYGAGGRITKG